MIDRTFFIYLHRRPDTGDVFYVGKGTRTPKKAYGRSHSGENRNPMWRRIVAKCGGKFASEVIAEFLNENDAFDMERSLIAEYGRKNLGLGTLANMTNGGEGAVGRKTKPSTIAKWRESVKGSPHLHAGKGPMLGRKHKAESREAIGIASRGSRNGMFGRSHSVESRLKMSAAIKANHATARRVIDAASEAVYLSVRDAAIATGLKKTTLNDWLRGKRRNPTSLRYA